MLFNSLSFLLFFPCVTLLYFLAPHKMRWPLLLIASCVFYMAFIPVYIFILAVTILIDYFAGKWIEDSSGKKRRLFLVMSIISTCFVLFVFKYFDFFNQNFAFIARLSHLPYNYTFVKIILPIGLSFHTFQSLSYVIEVYRGHQKAERHFGLYSLYVMFYPQLVAGPIERPQNLLHQFHEQHFFEYTRVTDGLKRMAWGLFKKVVIADRLAVVVNQVYNDPANYTGLPLIVATVFFAFQIFCDFSGYSDIALGAAQVMGFKLMENFKRPYFSKSISEFWKRWHISLSSWFRDYLYISIGGNQVVKWRWQFNLFITFLISGLWHGASWNFVIWGGLNGLYLLCGIWTKDIRLRLVSITRIDKMPFAHKTLRVLFSFALICIAWIFFRSKSLPDAWYIVTHLCRGLGDMLSINGVKFIFSGLGLANYDFATAIAAICLMETVHLVQRSGNITARIAKLPFALRWATYYGIVAGIVYFGVFESSKFIYFQF
jgi:alginate O-acetyltransferase complex protein AlgI